MQLNYTAIITGFINKKKKASRKCEKGTKKGKLPTSHRCDHRTLAAFPPWGVGQELVVWDLPGANIGKLSHLSNILCFLSQTDMKNAILELSLMYGK